jgi:hypothetical protein
VILVNLLPDLRQAKLRERRRRQLVSGIAVLIWSVCGGLVALMAIYAVGQKAYLANVTNQIKQKETQLQSMDDLIPAMTAQQHTASLSTLYSKRVYYTKFFKVYQDATPVDVTLSSVDIDENNILNVSGNAPSYAEAAKVSRALAECNVKVCHGKDGNTPYFTDVTLQASGGAAKGGVDFTITASVGAEATGK